MTMAQIESVERLRSIISAPHPMTKEKVLDHLDEQARSFIAHSPFLVMSTVGDAGVEASPKGDEPGFVQVVDQRTLVIPERPGNKLAFGLQNILANGQIGLLFFCPGTGETLRVTGRATLLDDGELLEKLSARGKPAVLAIQVDVARSFFHCARSVLRSNLWEPDHWPAKQTISFGRIMREKIKADEAVSQLIDTAVAASYRDL
ncbi:MAG: pyridoxamine 5'-phosphate oxidase family protein [Alphaproteobacteria bacterium]|nr:pyridoxamine 5'-phosphate oxidase family protein [Alphaproteobacteria bacterium]